MNKKEFEFLELVFVRPSIFGIVNANCLFTFFNGARSVLAIQNIESIPIIDCFFKFQTYCEKIFKLYRESPLSGINLLTIYCYYYKLDEYQFRKFLMAKFLKEEYNHEVSYEYEIFEIQDVKKPFEVEE